MPEFLEDGEVVDDFDLDATRLGHARISSTRINYQAGDVLAAGKPLASKAVAQVMRLSGRPHPPIRGAPVPAVVSGDLVDPAVGALVREAPSTDLVLFDTGSRKRPHRVGIAVKLDIRQMQGSSLAPLFFGGDPIAGNLRDRLLGVHVDGGSVQSGE